MAILSINEILSKIKERVGDDTTDETLNFIEDISDTLSDYERRSKDNTDWEKKYNDNDRMWREKYKARFFEGNTEDEVEEVNNVDSEPKALKFENLFTEVEK